MATLQELQVLAKKRQPAGDKVQFVLEANACKACRRLLTKAGEPRVFTRATLEKNGSNVGRKEAQWKATMPPLHPRCRCVLKAAT